MKKIKYCISCGLKLYGGFSNNHCEYCNCYDDGFDADKPPTRAEMSRLLRELPRNL